MNFKPLAALWLLCLAAPLLWAQEPAPKRLTNVEVLTLEPRPLTKYSTFMGQIEPAERAKLSAEVAGTVEWAEVGEGASVKKGEVLIKIETRRLKLNFDLARSNYELAADEYRREAELFKQNLSNQSKLTQAKNRMEVSKVQMQLAQLDLEKSQVAAPFDGVVANKKVDRGDYLAKGAPLLEVLSLSKVKAKVNVPEQQIGQVSQGGQVSVSLDALPGRSFEGEISSVGLQADTQSRSFPVEVTLANEKRKLLAGMLARVKMVTLEQKGQVIIPRDAVMEDEKGSYVFVFSGSRVVRRPVKPGASLGEELQIEQGLDFGEKLVVVGQQMVTHQEQVNLLKTVTQKTL